MNKNELDQQAQLLEIKQQQAEKEYQQRISKFRLGGILSFILFSLASIVAYQFRKRNRKIKAQNAIISNALKDKDYLLKEIHHRLKNNLQVISSLLSLQSRQIKDEGIKQAISEGRNRVRSMALIHQNLYQQDQVGLINVKKYLNNLTSELFDTYNISSDKIKLELDIDDLMLDVDMMVPMGLIINELVSNALKHAFTDGRDGTIKVRLKEQQENLLLEVSDDGIGTTDEQMNTGNSFGNRLVSAFVRKLNAEIKIENLKGTHIRISIMNYKDANNLKF